MNYPNLEKLIQVVKELRHPEKGCPWDLKQTHESLLKYLIEESYEFIDATEKKDDKEMEEEIGDVLLQVLLHSTLAEQRDSFNIESVSKILCEKLIRRHPHVFDRPDSNIEMSEIITNWEKIKLEEKAKNESKSKSLIDETYLKFPALFSANKIGKKTEQINFDWDDAHQVSYKVEEEWQELKEEIMPQTMNMERVKEEMGDFLFSAAQLSRHLGIDPEEALRDANKKFLRRFQAMENLIKEDGKDIAQMNQAQMDIFWDQAKANEKANQ